MEKYGVKTGSDDLTKRGSSEETCPKCGTAVEVHGTVRKCPKCGTEPFEGRQHGGEEGGK